eukprot:1703114-Rhodomonas_salina.1
MDREDAPCLSLCSILSNTSVSRAADNMKNSSRQFFHFARGRMYPGPPMAPTPAMRCLTLSTSRASWTVQLLVASI